MTNAVCYICAKFEVKETAVWVYKIVYKIEEASYVERFPLCEGCRLRVRDMSITDGFMGVQVESREMLPIKEVDKELGYE